MKNEVKITLIVGSCSLSSLPYVLEDIEATYGNLLDLVIYYVHDIERELSRDTAVKTRLRSSDIIMAHIMGNGQSVELLEESVADLNITVIPLFGGVPELLLLTRMGTFTIKDLTTSLGRSPVTDFTKMKDLDLLIEKLSAVVEEKAVGDVRNWVKIIKYWTNQSAKNLKNLLLFVTEEYGGLSNGIKHRIAYDDPQEFPAFGIYNPFMYETYTRASEYWETAGFDEAKPTVGLLYYGGVHFDASVVGARAIIERLKDYTNVLPVFTDGVQNLTPIREFFLDGNTNKRAVDAIISLIWFRLHGGPMGGDPAETLTLLERLNVPLFTPATLYLQEVDRWEESTSGVSPLEVLTTVTFPELDGAIEPIPVLGLRDVYQKGSAYVKATVVIEDRADRICGRVLNWLKLQNLKNDAKKIGIVIYDYPPGEGNIGGAAYLDTLASVEKILMTLRDVGFSLDLPNEPLRDTLLKKGILNSPNWISSEVSAAACIKVHKNEYKKWFSALPATITAQVVEVWGQPPGNIMIHGNDMLLPIIKLGNVTLGLQPSRGIHEDPSKAYHDKALPPHHQYIAFYKYLQEDFKADAIIHVGTHGTLEFTPGKELGLSSNCSPDQLIGDIPHVYLYHVTNPSEAMIAKRRSYGSIVSYMSPTFTRSDLYGDLLELDDLIVEYEHWELVNDTARTELIEREIYRRANDLAIEFNSIDDIRAELFEMKRSVIPQGLHTFGELPDEEGLVDYITFVLCLDRGAQKSLIRQIIESEGIDYEHALTLADGTVVANAEQRVRNIIKRYIFGHNVEANTTGLQPEELAVSLELGEKVVKAVRKSDEIGSLLHALNAGYITPNIAGDPIRTPEVFPTGSNLYQFDPRHIPTDLAYVRGQEIAENTIADYISKRAQYPETAGVVLWGFETAKTQGETVGQIFAYLGLKVIKGKGWYPKVAVIPLEELGRPRIDVNITICGFFRDLFPNLVTLIDEGIHTVAKQDEPHELNYIKKHVDELKERLRSVAVNPESVGKLSTARIFGPSAGQYGTNLTSIIETSNWENETQLADEYITAMMHAYGSNMHGTNAQETFAYLLERTDLTSQIRDSYEYEISDLDHYYEFFGGLTKSIEHLRGTKPAMFITDTTGEMIKTKSASSALKKGITTRLINPKWLDGMLEHDFHGAQKIADRVEYLIGFAATVGVESHIFSRVAKKLIFDDETFMRLRDNNLYSTYTIAARLMEAHTRGYWEATEEELDLLKQAYLTLEDILER
jgi:cobaltochelatase CobN